MYHCSGNQEYSLVLATDFLSSKQVYAFIEMATESENEQESRVATAAIWCKIWSQGNDLVFSRAKPSAETALDTLRRVS